MLCSGRQATKADERATTQSNIKEGLTPPSAYASTASRCTMCSKWWKACRKPTRQAVPSLRKPRQPDGKPTGSMEHRRNRRKSAGWMQARLDSSAPLKNTVNSRIDPPQASHLVSDQSSPSSSRTAHTSASKERACQLCRAEGLPNESRNESMSVIARRVVSET